MLCHSVLGLLVGCKLQLALCFIQLTRQDQLRLARVVVQTTFSQLGLHNLVQEPKIEIEVLSRDLSFSQWS